MKLKNIFAAAVLSLAAVVPTMAQQEQTVKYPKWFIGAQMGGQTTFTNYDNSKLITPTIGLYGGLWFNRIVGARLHLNGVWNKGGVALTDALGQQFDHKYEYNYVNTSLDGMLNLCTLFGRKEAYPVNLYLIGGVGINTAFNNDDAYGLKSVTYTDKYYGLAQPLLPWAWGDERKICCSGRVGLQLDWLVTDRVGVNLEVDANSMSDRYNSKRNEKNDWQLTAAVGVTYRFGKKAKKPAPVVEEEWATRIDTIWYDEPVEKNRVENGQAKWEVFYEIRESDMEGADAKIRAIGRFLKDYRDCKISVKSYADRGTGNPRVNLEYSKQRSEKAVKALVESGVSESLITAEYFGDTVQPYADNDKNRVTIIVATGLKDIKDKSSVKKFRTEEVRYRVK